MSLASRNINKTLCPNFWQNTAPVTGDWTGDVWPDAWQAFTVFWSRWRMRLNPAELHVRPDQQRPRPRPTKRRSLLTAWKVSLGSATVSGLPWPIT